MKKLNLDMDKPRTNQHWFELDRKYRIEGRRIPPVVMEKAKGVHIWDVEGNKYLDFGSGQMAMLTGHSHPAVVQALKEQSELLMHTSNTVINIPRILLAQKLAEIAPGALQKSFFACAGSESVDHAIRLAKKYTGRFEVVGVLSCFHGRTVGPASYSSSFPRARAGYGPHLTGATFIPAPYCYRCWFKETPPCNLSCLDYAEEVIERTTSGEPAVFVFEVMIGGGGMVIPPKEWVKRVRKICDERNTILIDDESLTGIGRTGKWFACDHYDLVPDILTTSKGLGGGVPLSAVITSDAIASSAIKQGYIGSATHMGDPLQCAVGLANLKVIEENNLLGNANKVGTYLKQGFESLAKRFEVIGDVRGVGLFLGVEFVESQETKKQSYELTEKFVDGCRQRGLLISKVGALQTNVIRNCPPLTITEEDAAQCLNISEDALKALKA